MQKSPFYPNGNDDGGSLSFSIYIEPYLNTYFKVYQNIITVNAMPAGPLQNMVASISSPKLSPFQEFSPLSGTRSICGCKLVIMRYPVSSGFSIKYGDSFMVDSDVPALLNYLTSNGYQIETGITKILQKSNIGLSVSNSVSNSYSGKKTLICVATFLR